MMFKDFLFYIWVPFCHVCSEEQKRLISFEEHLWEIVLNLDQNVRCHFKQKYGQFV